MIFHFPAPHTPLPPPSPCSVEEFDCGDVQCLYNGYVCDGRKDCADERDEAGCTNYTRLFTRQEGFKVGVILT